MAIQYVFIVTLNLFINKLDTLKLKNVNADTQQVFKEISP